VSLRIPNYCLLIVTALGAGAASVGHAQSSSPAADLLKETVVLDAGLFVLGTTTKANLNGNGVRNPQVDFNHTFGTGYDNSRFRLDALWRITPRQHVEFMYFTNGVSRTQTLDKQINWGNDQFDVGASVTGKTRLSVYAVSYEYAFVRKPTFELAASAGIHFTKATLDISGVGTVTGSAGQNGSAMFESKSASVPAPLPVIGLRTSWAFANNWMLDAHLQLLGFSYDQFDGYWSDARLGVTYLFNRHFGIGAGYDAFIAHLNVSSSNFEGRLNTGYRGGLIYVTGAF
jgi:hypothetical protein